LAVTPKLRFFVTSAMAGISMNGSFMGNMAALAIAASAFGDPASYMELTAVLSGIALLGVVLFVWRMRSVDAKNAAN
jgi:hypothetical protein